MAKTIQTSKKDRINKILNEFEGEFVTLKGNPYCLNCKVDVNCDQLYPTIEN